MSLKFPESLLKFPESSLVVRDLKVPEVDEPPPMPTIFERCCFIQQTWIIKIEFLKKTFSVGLKNGKPAYCINVKCTGRLDIKKECVRPSNAVVSDICTKTGKGGEHLFLMYNTKQNTIINDNWVMTISWADYRFCGDCIPKDNPKKCCTKWPGAGSTHGGTATPEQVLGTGRWPCCNKNISFPSFTALLCNTGKCDEDWEKAVLTDLAVPINDWLFRQKKGGCVCIDCDACLKGEQIPTKNGALDIPNIADILLGQGTVFEDLYPPISLC